MRSVLESTHCHLVGIKGVGMTSLAQLLTDAGISITGCDLVPEYVTQPILTSLGIPIATSFETAIPAATDCLVFTAAHGGTQNPQVQAAQAAGIPTFSHAEALGHFFNSQQGVAVCGVGGKSTTSAMIVWIMTKLGMDPSFSVGVGKIIGLEKTGRYNPTSNWFIAEADEFVTDPTAPSRGEAVTPRFWSLHPQIVVSKELLWDHPDVYPTESAYLAAFRQFFSQIDTDGTLIYKQQKQLPGIPTSANKQVVYAAGAYQQDIWFTIDTQTTGEVTRATLHIDTTEYPLELHIPGLFNVENAVAAVLVCREMGITVEDAVAAIASFQSTQRRVERIGEKRGVLYYDDYAHHPFELSHVIASFKQWYPDRRLVIAFQPHTYSRTKELFSEFVKSLSTTDELVLLDIFASARESADPSISSAMLAEALKKQGTNVQQLPSIPDLAAFCRTSLRAGDVCLTVGAGDIYQVHDML